VKRAQIVTGAAIHPDTGELIPWPQRLRSFLFMQLPLSAGLKLAPPTTFNTLFWQWATQSYYAGLNYGNRNATNILSTVSIWLSYTAAAVSSVVLALILRKTLMTRPFKTGTQISMNAMTSFMAMAGAGFVNATVMRSTELTNSIELFGEDNHPIGYSKIAAWTAVLSAASTRALLAGVTVLAPGVVTGLLEQRGYLPRGGIQRSLAELFIMASVMALGLPACIAFFSQRGSIRANRVEWELRDIPTADGQKPHYYYYNRGL